ncbi:MAG: adenylate/guanylate cyclase domain-containing protein [bacterium]|nr:adenylate/guanylate cyclase domain-containing protein [bacterium]
MEKSKVKNLSIGFAISVCSVLFILLFTEYLSFFEDFERKTLDSRFNFRTDYYNKKFKEEFQNIVIIEIDDESATKLGRISEWPRSMYAKVLDYISEGGAKQIGFDVLFTENSKDLKDDNLLIESIKRSQRVYSSYYFSAKPGTNDEIIRSFSYPLGNELDTAIYWEQYIFPPIYGIVQNSKGIGFINLKNDRDGIIRRIPLFIKHEERAYPQFAVKMAIDYLGISNENIRLEKGKYFHFNDIKIPVGKDNQMLVNYAGYYVFRYIPFWKIYEQIVPKEYFQDKIVFIAATAAGAYDLRSTPVKEISPGIEINANAFFTIINKNFVIELNSKQAIIILLFLSLFCFVISNIFSLGISIIATAFLWILYFTSALVLFQKNSIWLPLIKPTLVIFTSFTGNLGYKYLSERKQKKFIQGAFQRYVSPAVLKELMQDPEKINLYGEEKELTVLFSDIRGFTTFSENLSPKENVAVLNEYFRRMAKIVFKHDGMLDKFIGDAIMVVFGAPIIQANHAERACLCALEMIEEANKFSKEQEEKGKHQFKIGVGINTGNMILGNMGSDTKMDYTVIGDNVNLGSRIESLNKDYKTSIIISESTYEKVRDKFIVKDLGNVTVKGRKAETKIYELLQKI